MRCHMKIVIIVTVLAFFCFFYGCQRELADYRSRFTGKWAFIVEINVVNTDSIGCYASDTVCFDGVISSGDKPNEILIHYTEENKVQLIVDEEGVLSGFPTHYCAGEFESDNKVHLYLRWGGLGGGITHIVKGEKLIINSSRN